MFPVQLYIIIRIILMYSKDNSSTAYEKWTVKNYNINCRRRSQYREKKIKIYISEWQKCLKASLPDWNMFVML